MPQEIFERRNELFSPDEPFCILEQGRADEVRIKDTDAYIPPDTAKWFRGGGYKDYFALPDIHRGQSKGGIAWSTKNPGGFSEDDLQFFRLTQPALTSIMRLQTNDLVVHLLMSRNSVCVTCLFLLPEKYEKIYQKLRNLGITHDMDFLETKRLTLLNEICIWIILFPTMK